MITNGFFRNDLIFFVRFCKKVKYFFHFLCFDIIFYLQKQIYYANIRDVNLYYTDYKPTK